MPRFHCATEDEVEPAAGYAPSCSASSPIVARRLTPDSFPLWLYVSTFGDGAELSWAIRAGLLW